MQNNKLFSVIEAGLPLYPVNPRNKAPLKKFKNLPGLTEVELQKQINLGHKCFATVPASGNFIALDLDVRRGINGPENLHEYLKKTGTDNIIKLLREKVPWVRSPGLGIHFYFKYSGSPVLNSSIFPGVEVKSTSLLTAPGSIDNRGKYRLHKNLKTAPQLPAEIEKLLIPRQREKKPVIQNTIYDFDFSRMEKIILKQGYSFIPGARNRFLFKLSLFACRQRKPEIETINYCLQYVEPDFTPAEIRETVKSAYRLKGI